MTDQPDFIYFECGDCGFDSVQREDFKGSSYCPLCAGDSGHDVLMKTRTANSDDKPEGFDARKGTRAEQEAVKAAADRAEQIRYTCSICGAKSDRPFPASAISCMRPECKA